MSVKAKKFWAENAAMILSVSSFVVVGVVSKSWFGKIDMPDR